MALPPKASEQAAARAAEKAAGRAAAKAADQAAEKAGASPAAKAPGAAPDSLSLEDQLREAVAEGRLRRTDPLDRRTKGFARCADVSTALMRPAFEKRGFFEARIAADWPVIVGLRLARLCRPVKILRQGGRAPGEGGVLVIGARGGAAMELTHAAPQIVERVNVFYGHRAVERIRIDQTLSPAAPPPAAPPPPPEAPPPLAAPIAALDSIDDPALRAALERLARNRVLASSSNRKVP